jgi:hypothetical protein
MPNAPGTAPTATLFETALGERWQALPAAVRRLHSGAAVERFAGRATVTRGSSLLARTAVWLLGFPAAGEDLPLTLTIQRTMAGETWQRSFAGAQLRSFLSASPRPFHYRERFGPFTYEQELPVEDGVLHLPARRGWLLGLPLPRFLLAKSCTREFAEDGVFHFDVGLFAPLTGGLIVRYRGWLRPEAD